MGIWQQFSHPRGRLGWVVGKVMAFRNRKRSQWVLSLLDLTGVERVLEIGYGSGADIERVSERAAQVVGIDHSEAMLRMATARNRRRIESGQVELCVGEAAELPYAEGSFDRVFAINVAHFWSDVTGTLQGIRRVLREGGRAVIAVQPRHKGATRESSHETAKKLEMAMREAGFTHVETRIHDLKPVPVAAVSGVR